jgi:hypothetical protein
MTGAYAAAENAADAASMPLPPPLPQSTDTRSFEERIGTRWVVWVGGLTLALGGFFMVRYSIEAGLIGPGVRVMLGGAFALALLAAGEFLRRKQDPAAIDALPIANIPAILTAAGTAVAFATVYAAHALYGFLAPATAFILLGLVALGTLAAALLHGPALAGLGVAAGFITPILVSSDKPDFWALYIYLAIITAASFALARVRLWRWLAVTTIVFALAWTFPCLECMEPMVGPHVFHIVAGFVLAVLLVVCGFMFGPPAEQGRIEPISSGSLAAYLFGATAIVITRLHADAAMIAFRRAGGGDLADRMARSRRDRRGRCRRTVCRPRVPGMGRARQSGDAGGAGRRHSRYRTARDRRLGYAAFDVGFDLRSRLWGRGISGAGPFGQRDRPGGVVGDRGVHPARAAGRTLRAHRPSRPLGAVCDPRRDPRRRVRHCYRTSRQA